MVSAGVAAMAKKLSPIKSQFYNEDNTICTDENVHVHGVV